MAQAAEIFRDYVVDGVPASGANKPVKSDIRAWGLALENGIKGVHNANIPSATTLDLTAAAGELVDVTGTTTVTAITLPDGNVVTVRFTGALTLTHGASLVLPSAANILTVAGDFAIFRGYAAGVVRCVSYFRADGKALIAPTAGTLVGAGQILNATIAESRAANAVTFALKTLAGADPSSGDPVKAYFRNATPGTGNYVERSITAALSVTIPSTATMGFTSGEAGKIWLVLVDDGGTPRLGVVNCLTSANNIYPLGQFPIVGSTTIGTGADNAHVIYTDAGVTAKPYLVLGYASYEGANKIATAGTWANAPLRIHLQGPNDPLPGALIQQPRFEDAAVATGTTVIPSDNTIPQITEGDQYLAQAITPTSEANVFDIDSNVNGAASTGTALTMALFQDATAGALAVRAARTGSNLPDQLSLSKRMKAATIAATTFRIRAAGTAGTFTFNGGGGTGFYNGTLFSHLGIRELMA